MPCDIRDAMKPFVLIETFDELVGYPEEAGKNIDEVIASVKRLGACGLSQTDINDVVEMFENSKKFLLEQKSWDLSKKQLLEATKLLYTATF